MVNVPREATARCHFILVFDLYMERNLNWTIDWQSEFTAT